MKFAYDDQAGVYAISSYGRGRILVRGAAFTRSLVVTPDRVIADWEPQHPADLRAEHFDALLGLDPQILILGTGVQQAFPSPALYRGLLERRVGIEVMDTAAACRTYNILVGEGRRVVAALIML
jgi:uncharacterized protein